MTRRDQRRQAEGFALAAAAHEDAAAERTRAGLGEALERSLRVVAVELSGTDRAGRRAFVRALLERRELPAAAQGVRLPRALAWLATSVERERGRAWLGATTPPRPGYQPHPRLLALLRRLAAEPAPVLAKESR